MHCNTPEGVSSLRFLTHSNKSWEALLASVCVHAVESWRIRQRCGLEWCSSSRCWEEGCEVEHHREEEKKEGWGDRLERKEASSQTPGYAVKRTNALCLVRLLWPQCVLTCIWPNQKGFVLL